MSNEIHFGVKLTYDGKEVAGGLTLNREQLRQFGEEAKRSSASAAAGFDSVGAAATRAAQQVKQSSAQAAFAMRMLPAQMTDIATGLASGQSPFMVLMQQGGQLKDMFGGIGPAVRAVGGYVAGLVTPFTVAAAAAAGLGYVLYKSFHTAEEPAKDLESAVGDLGAAIRDVGKTARDISMDNLYKEFNRASAGARETIVEQVRFQQAMIETQALAAHKSLSKTLEGVGEYGTLDKLKGAFAESGSEKLARELGVSVSLASDLLPAIRGLRNGTEDAGNFMARFGAELAKSGKGATQKLIADIKSVADGSRDAAAAQTRLSEALQKMNAAGASGQIDIPGKRGNGRDPDDALDDAMHAAWRRNMDADQRDLERLRRQREAAEHARAAMRETAAGLEAAYARDNARSAEAAMPTAQRDLAESLRQVEERAAAARREIARKAAALKDDVAAQAAMRSELEKVTAAEAAQKAAVRALWEEQQALNASWQYGARQALREYADEADNVAARHKRAWGDAMRRSEDLVIDVMRRKKDAVRGFVDYTINELLRVRAAQPFVRAIGGWLDGLFDSTPSLDTMGGDAGLAAAASIGGGHSGALVGAEATFMRKVPLSIFADAPRYHGGGFIGPGEVPIIAKRGEGVFTEGQMKKLAPVGAGRSVTLHYAPVIDARESTPGMLGRLDAMLRESEQRVRAMLIAEANSGGEFAYATGRR